MKLRRMVLTAGATVGLLAVTAGGASAATKYVSPGGPGLLPCTDEATPCAIEQALTGLLAGDVVRMAPGEYAIPALPLVDATFEGKPKQARPVVTVGSTSGLPLPMQFSTTLRRLHVLAEDPLSLGNGMVEDSIVESDVASPVLQLASATIKNSVVWARGADATAITVAATPPIGLPTMPASATAKLQNATIVATAVAVRAVGSGMLQPPAPGLPASCSMFPAPMAATVELTNVIARGGTQDLVTQSGTCGALSEGRIKASHSNFGTVPATFTDLGGNQSALPKFVDAAAGNFAPVAGSPTIDAGTPVEGLGDFDLAGSKRIVGALPDIGAFEFVPPVTPPGGGTPGGGTPGGGTPGGGTPGGGTPGGGSPGTTDKAPTVKLLKAKGLRLRALLKRGWKLRVSCSEACRFAMTLTTAKGKKRVLARGAARTTKAGTTTLRLKITKAGRRALKAQKKAIRLRVSVVARDSAGQRGAASRVLRARR